MNHLSSSSPPPSGDNSNEIIAQMMRAPLVMMCTKLKATILQEWEIACGIYNNHTKELDDVYLGHVERFKGVARNTVDKFFERF